VNTIKQYHIVDIVKMHILNRIMINTIA